MRAPADREVIDRDRRSRRSMAARKAASVQPDGQHGRRPSTAALDPFPRDAWTTLTGHAAGYLRLTVALVRDPAVSKHRRAALLAAAAYFASPIHLIPGIVPVLGQVDDLAVAMLAIRLALNALEPDADRCTSRLLV